MTDLDEAVVERVVEAMADSHDESYNAAFYGKLARAALRLLASEGRLCEPGTVEALETARDTLAENKPPGLSWSILWEKINAALPKPGG